MVSTGKVLGTDTMTTIKTTQTEAIPTKYEFFTSTGASHQDNYTSTMDWNNSLNSAYQKLGIGTYTWAPINGVDDAVQKSEDNFIDLLRYYEGHNSDYTAKTKYKDNEKINTYGYGLTTTAMKAIGNWDKANAKVINLPKTQTDAYMQLLKYLNDVSKPEVENSIGKELFNKLPNSIKAALLDYQFKNGITIMNSSKLKTKLTKAASTNKTEDWTAVLKELVYAYPASSKAEHVENSGIYRRSLSRVILAAKGLKHDVAGIDSAAIDKAVKEVYTAAVNCAKKNNINTADFDRIYNTYSGTNANSKSINSNTKNSYKVPQAMGFFSAANAIIPKGTAAKNGLDPKDIRIAVIKETMRLNNIPYIGDEKDGYPKVSMLKTGQELELPSSVKIKGKTITLQTPENWEKAEVISNDDKAISNTQDETEEPVAGTYIVKEGQGWWQIARDIAPDNYTEHQIKELSAAIAAYNNNAILQKNDTIKLPPENWQGNEEPAIDKENEELEVQTPVLTTMLKTIPHESKKIGNTKDFECITFKYKIKERDKIFTIANEYGVDWKTLLANNNLTENSARNLSINQEIKINKIAYTVKKGESIASIASKYGLSVDLLKALNGNNEVKQNDKIEIPGYIYKTVKGDNLSKIAKNAGITTEQLKSLNGLKSNNIDINKELLILYNNPDYNIPEEKKSTIIEGDSKIQIIENTNPKNKDRKYFKLQKENGVIVATRKVFEPNQKGALSGKTVIINAGHGYCANGSIDIGTNMNEIINKKLASKNDGTPDEYQCNYDNAMRLKDELVKRGAKVIYLQGKAELIQKELEKSRNKADFFISIHVNSHDKKTQDRTIFEYTNTDTEKYPATAVRDISRRIVEQLEHRFDDWISKHETISGKDRFMNGGIQDYAQIRTQGLGVCNSAEKYQKCPSILWEIAFMANSKGRERLKNDKLMQQYAQVAAEEIEKALTAKPDNRPRYTVKKGDSLGSIARNHNTTVEALQKINGIRGNAIREGQNLIIPEKKTRTQNTTPAKNTHKVKQGENLSRIAKKYNTTVDAIKKANKIKEDTLSIGQILIIPKK